MQSYSLAHDYTVIITREDIDDLRMGSNAPQSIKDLFEHQGDKVLWHNFEADYFTSYSLPTTQAWGIWWLWPAEPKLGILIRFKPFQIMIGLVKWGIAIGPRTVKAIPQRRASVLSVGG